MAKNDGVSRGVSSRVSPGVSLEEDLPRPARKARHGARGAGPYLVRSGSVYLFQIRVPKALGGGRGLPPVRVSLGPRSQREARHLAVLLAAQARLRFERMLMDQDGKDGLRKQHPGHDEPDGEHGHLHDDMRADLKAMLQLAEMKGELKLAAQLVSQPVSPMTLEEQTRAQAWHGLVGIAREIAKGAEGNPLVKDNSALLSSQYADRLMSTVSPLAPAEPSSPPYARSFERPQVQQKQVHPTFAPPPCHSEMVGPAPARDDALAFGQDAFDDDEVAGYDLDRRHVRRPTWKKPTFSRMAENYLAAYSTKSGAGNKDVRIARARCDLFVEVIGDHPVDTYNGTDLQAWVNFLKHWPGNNNHRNPDWSAREVVAGNQDLHQAPVAYKTLVEGYVSVVKRVIRWQMTKLQFSDPFAGVRLFYPATAAPPKPAQPLSAEKISAIFSEGVSGGMLTKPCCRCWDN